jgi:hypothetical protein
MCGWRGNQHYLGVFAAPFVSPIIVSPITLSKKYFIEPFAE